jgi:hypothetical protein
VQVGDDVQSVEHGSGGGADEESGVVIEDVQDLDLAAVREGPVGDVGLPAFVGQVGFEPPPRGARSLVRLRGDEPALGENPPDRRD